jgi:cytochrome c553
MRGSAGIIRVMVPMGLLWFAGLAMAWEAPQEGDEMDQATHLQPNLENGKKIFRICTHCHTEDGQGIVEGIARRHPSGYYPKLAGQHVNVLIKQLADIRAGNRDNPMMYPFTLDKYIGGAQGIADVSAYISSLPTNDVNTQGFGNDLNLGEQLYRENCTECHGEQGEGDNEKSYPRLQGQHYDYMLRQFRWIKNGQRRNSNRKMVEQIGKFSYRDMKAVIDYASRLRGKTQDEAQDGQVSTDN